MTPNKMYVRPALKTLAVCLLVLLTACVDLAPVTSDFKTTSNVTDWRDEVIYQLMVDRFADGDPNNNWNVRPDAPTAYHGGDWQGVIDNLDYLEKLGVTAIWISPVVKNVEEDAGIASYHGYWTQDFVNVNPHFGDIAKLREMVLACHARGIKVILDIVVNHIGQLFYYDINNNGQPDDMVMGSGTRSPLTRTTEWDPDFDPRGIQAFTSLGESGPAPVRWVYSPEIMRTPPNPPEFANADWYNLKGRVTDWNDWDQVVTGDFPGGLKDIKTTHPDVRAALLKAFEYWIDAADFDAFRIDTLKHVEHEFWQTFCPGIRKHCQEIGKKNFFMFGEAFDGDDALLGSFTRDNEVDSVFYFSQKFRVIDGVFKGGGPTSAIRDLYEERALNYALEPVQSGVTDEEGNGVAPHDLLVNFIDNHDIPRFLFEFPHPENLRAALFFLFTWDGIPCVYYGTEQDFEGGNDPANREDLWPGSRRTEGATFRHISELAKIRRTLAPLRRGDNVVRYATDHIGGEQDAGIFAFERNYNDEKVLVVLNAGKDHASDTSYQGEDMVTGFAEGTRLVNVWGAAAGETVGVGAGGRFKTTVPPLTGKIFTVK